LIAGSLAGFFHVTLQVFAEKHGIVDLKVREEVWEEVWENLGDILQVFDC